MTYNRYRQELKTIPGVTRVTFPYHQSFFPEKTSGEWAIDTLNMDFAFGINGGLLSAE